jgi:hypothetical protein
VNLLEPPGLIRRYGPPEVTEHRHLVQVGRRARSKVGFDRVKALQAEGKSLAEIVRATGFHWRTVRKWTQLEAMWPRDDGSETDHTERLCQLPGTALDRGLHDGNTVARGDPPARLHR